MDVNYTGSPPSKNYFGVIIVILVLVVIAASIFFLTGRKKIISPLPDEPSFEVVFYTPTPSQETPTSSPSATPVEKKSPSATAKPKDTTPTQEPTEAPNEEPTATSTP